MPTAFYIIPYVRRTPPTIPALYERYLAILDVAGVTAWKECEVRGNRAVVKVQASALVLTTLNGLYKRLPVDLLDDPLSSLSAGPRAALRNELLDQGFTQGDLDANFPNGIGSYTLRQVLIYAARHRRLFRNNNDVLEETAEEADNSAGIDVIDRAIV